MLMPKRTKYRRPHRVSYEGKAKGGKTIAFGEYGKGRSAVFTTDCAPHWAPPEFCEWEDYNNVWAGIVDWLTE